MGQHGKGQRLHVIRDHEVTAVQGGPGPAGPQQMERCPGRGAEALKQYVIRLVAATRTSPDLRLGASPRATLHLLRAGRARAALDGRDFVIPDDMQARALPVLAHRLLPSAEAVVTRQPPEQVLAAIVDRVPLPQLR